MNESDLLELKQEVKALRLLVYYLLEQNEAMKAEFIDLKQEIQSKILQNKDSWQDDKSDKAICSITLQQIVSDSPICSTSLQQDDTDSPIHSTTSQDIESNSSIHSTPLQDIASDNPIRSTSPEDVTVNSSIDSNLPEGCGTSENKGGDSLLPDKTNHSIPPLPLKISLSNSNIYPLASQLRQADFGGGKESPCQAAAKLFIHFYNEQPGERNRLRKLTGYSEGGLAKLLMRLRAQGYLIKTGFQQHAITGKALELMQKAGCK